MGSLLESKRLFPCPVCGEALEVKQTKKKKPYVVCDPCGVQLFVRNETGIGRFERLVAQAEQKDVWKHLEDMEDRYRKACPECGKAFWIEPKLVETSWLDGSFKGYRCPEPNCEGIVTEEVKE